ncbi:response regulator [Methanolobus psychrotolerans]|uniref:response regulator n=1 Tax=Methanolobus psychrotolerans TaxID=1874706 RepID=UPI000B9160BF|nr:response regulator [Methanolobus psychrotolerans]
MKMTRRSLSAVMMVWVLIFIIFCSGTVHSQTEDTVRIGVLIEGSEEETLAKWTIVSEYLSEDIPIFTFEIVPMDKSAIENQLMAENIDFLIADPATYVMLTRPHGITSIATMKTVAYLPPDYTKNSSLNNVGSVIFTKADRVDIQNLDDIIGLSFLAPESPFFEGWWIAKREFIEHRIVPETDFEALEFSSELEAIVYSVKDGDFDAGTVPSGVLEQMHMEGKINISDFKVIHLQKYDNYPLLVSTRIYPGWAFSKTRETSRSISERVSISLLSMSFNSSDSGSFGDISGWTVSQDYNVVEACMMELKVGMFEEPPALLDTIMRLKSLLAGIMLLLVIAAVNIFYVHDLNKKLGNEIIAKTETEKILKRKHSLENTMLDVSSMFTYPGDVDEAINMALSEIGTLCGANRCYLFLFSKDETLMSNTHEWCSEGVEAQKENLQDLPSDMLPWWLSRLQNDEMINVTDVSALPSEASVEKEILEMQDIKSVLVLPVFIEGHLVGFVGLDDVDGTREWENDDFETLQMFSTLMAMVLKRRKMEQSLRKSELHLKRVLEGSNEGTWDVNLQDDILIFNTRYADIIGHPVDEISPRFEWMRELIHPDDVHVAISELQNVRKGVSETAECEYRIRGKDGKYRWVFNKGKVVEYSEDGKPLHMAGILADISERKEAQNALIAAKKAAEDASRTKSDFLANMSHELRTPLNSVIGFSDILLEGTFGSLNDKQKRYVGNISNSGRHLLNLINDILDLSKIEAGKMVLNIDEFDIGGSLDGIKSVISPLAFKKDIKLIIKLVPDIITIKADKGKFKQIIYNLLSNAIKFTDNGGQIIISVTKKDDHVRVEVTDTGIGISQEDQKKLFKTFTQIDSSNCRMYEGTGLGLVLVRSFIEQHNGRIWVESESGKGSSFIFELPVEFEPSADEAGSEHGNWYVIPEEESSEYVVDTSIADSGKWVIRPLILIVEDEKRSQEILSVTLNDAGYDVKFAANGKEALELAKELQPFAITLDIMMSDMDGWDILKNLKQEKGTEDIPVVIVSILDEKDLGIIWGAFDYFVKPVDREALLSSLGRLKKKRSFEHVNVLVIDDEPSVLELMESMLLTEGYDVMGVSNGKDGIEKALSFSPDIIILDLMMPKVSGFDVINELKKHPETIDIPIIVCTAKDLEDHEKKQLDRDVSFVMQKGIFSKKDLLHCINNVEELSSSRKQEYKQN